MKKSLYMGCDGHAKEEDLGKLERSGEYVAEPKFDGEWSVVKSLSFEQRFYSRNNLIQAVDFPQLPAGVWLVGELAIGQQDAIERQKEVGHQFMDVYDILRVGGEDTMDYDSEERRAILKMFMDTLDKKQRDWFRLAPRWSSGFKKQYENQSEGLVLKRIRGRERDPYIPDSRNKHWLKVKREITVDMVVLDFKKSGAVSLAGVNNGKGAAKCLTCGVLRNGAFVPLVDVGSFDRATKIDVIENWKKYFKRVVEIKCYKVFKSGSLRHPSLVRFRDDKDKEDCTWEALQPYMS